DGWPRWGPCSLACARLVRVARNMPTCTRLKWNQSSSWLRKKRLRGLLLSVCVLRAIVHLGRRLSRLAAPTVYLDSKRLVSAPTC
ncbi:hypothetical protein H4S04_007357, partial [Coemansia sp. S16]